MIVKLLDLKAYAKVNLTLDIVGTREDGYHLLESVFHYRCNMYYRISY